MHFLEDEFNFELLHETISDPLRLINNANDRKNVIRLLMIRSSNPVC